MIEDFLKERGLRLSEEKSKITHINEGFNFLSQNIRKYKGKLGTFIYRQLKRWAKHQHGNKNRWWIYRRYFMNKHFTDKRAAKKAVTCYRLFRIGYVPIRYHVKIKSNANPYLPEFDKYFYQRQKWRVDLAKECKEITTFVDKGTENNSRGYLRRDSLKSA